MKLKHSNIKPKVVPVLSFLYGQFDLPYFFPQVKNKELTLRERPFRKHNGICFGPKWPVRKRVTSLGKSQQMI